jgi:hypothetical protein
MSEVNQCDLNCPVKAYKKAKYEEDTQGANPVKKAMLASAVGAQGVAQMVRASSCPQSHLPEGEWTPNQACIEEVASSLRDHPLDPTQFDDYERRILGQFFEAPPA